MSVIKKRLAAGQIVRTMHVLGYATPRTIEMAGLLGNFHGVWFDQEHSAIPQSQLELMLIACRASGLDALRGCRSATMRRSCGRWSRAAAVS